MGYSFSQATGVRETIRWSAAPGEFRLDATLRLDAPGAVGLAFGANDVGSGFALVADLGEQTVRLMELKHNAVLIDRGMRRCTLKAGEKYPVRVEYAQGAMRAWFNENPLDAAPWPKFDLALTLPGSLYGAVSAPGTGRLSDVRASAFSPKPMAESYCNPVCVGADPDILLHDGVYYLYNRVPNDPTSREDAYLLQKDGSKPDRLGGAELIFRVSRSTDLVHWSEPKPVFERDPALTGAFCMSPNVFEKDGWFYLLFAAGRLHGEESFQVLYATSRSPEGPFRLMGSLHTDAREIGGMPFVDEDGSCYITYVRFDRGNHIWLQRLDVASGVITPDDATLTHILSPEEPYECDEYGRIVEGGVLIPHKGLYYLLYADGHYLGHYGESYAISSSIYGPYVRHRNNPVLHHHLQADGTGDGIVIYYRDRTRMMLGYHRHFSPTEVEPRMTCVDEMKFVPDPEGGPDLLTVHGPTTAPQPMPFSD